MPLLGEQTLVDAVEQDTAVLKRHGQTMQQHTTVEWRQAGEENPLACDISAHVVVLGFLGRRCEAGLGRGPGGEGGGDCGVSAAGPTSAREEGRLTRRSKREAQGAARQYE